MGFDYLEFWSDEESQTAEQQNADFEKTKGELIVKPLITDKVLIVDSKDHTIQETRQRPKDLNNYFLKQMAKDGIIKSKTKDYASKLLK